MDDKEKIGPVARWLGHPSVVLVFGVRGSGKSVFLRQIAKTWDAPGKVGIVDSLNFGDTHTYGDKVWRYPPQNESDLQGFSLLEVDEADQWMPQKHPNRQNPVLTNLIRRGRHYNLTLAMATQRPSALCYDAWSLVDHLFVFSLTSDIDLRRVAEIDYSLRAQRERITYLQPGQYMHWDRHGAMGRRVSWGVVPKPTDEGK